VILIARAIAAMQNGGSPVVTSTPKIPTRCLECSGSGFRTGATGVCTTLDDCPACGGTGKPPKHGPLAESDGRGDE
jgi:DnaJ-class molecular chaperone